MTQTTKWAGPPSELALLEACLELVGEVGFAAATTKAIAERASVNEVTIFRRFATKGDLISAALEYATAPMRASVVAVSDDITADLVDLAEGYAQFAHQWPNLIARVLPEVASESDIGRRASLLIAGNAEAVRGLFEHHFSHERLVPADPDRAMVAFLGPILVDATLGTALRGGKSAADFDATRHVQCFLGGWGQPQ